MQKLIIFSILIVYIHPILSSQDTQSDIANNRLDQIETQLTRLETRQAETLFLAVCALQAKNTLALEIEKNRKLCLEIKEAQHILQLKLEYLELATRLDNYQRQIRSKI